MTDEDTNKTDDTRARPGDRFDDALNRLTERKNDWVRVPIQDRIAYLRQCIDGVMAVAEEWVAEAARRRGMDPASPLPGEEWIAGPLTTVRWMRLMIRALNAGGEPRPAGLRRREDGQIVAGVFPADLLDRLLYYNMKGEIWIEPGKPATQGHIYREKAAGRFAPGRLGLVLGAGNVSSIPPLDLLYKLFVEDQVVLLKLNPVNAYLGPRFEAAFAPLIRDGYLVVVGGGADVGAMLCRDPRVETIHLTGSDGTYDAIVWGEDRSERAARKAEGTPRVDKPVTAELGCVSPILVVPGRWSSSDLDFHARQIAGMVAHNASFNCNAGKALILARGWNQRETFLERLKAALARTPPRVAYYPGAQQRYRAFVEQYPQALVLGEEGEGVVPWTLIPDVPAVESEFALVNEAFCGVLAQVNLDSGDTAAFLRRAVDFVNDNVWGTLSCTLLVDRRTSGDHRDDVEDAVARLRYGGVGINVWAGVLYAFGTPSWGGFPGHTRESIGSGQGVVHNACLFDHPQKSVLRAAFRLRPKPVWFPDHRSLLGLGRNLTAVEANRSLRALIATAYHGLRG